ncbi:hypothetical protein RB601_002871 [Gaeumannomyces tritici]
MANYSTDSGFFSIAADSSSSQDCVLECPWNLPSENQAATQSSATNPSSNCDNVSLAGYPRSLLSATEADGIMPFTEDGLSHPTFDEVQKLLSPDSIPATEGKRQDLRRQLLAAKTRSVVCDGDSWFIPLADIAAILTPGRISKCLWPAMEEEETQHVHEFLTSNRNVVGILALMGRLDYFPAMVCTGVVDAVLPLKQDWPSNPELLALTTTASLWPSSGLPYWSNDDTCHFLDLQWAFLAPRFNIPPPGSVGQTLQFDGRTVLPFVQPEGRSEGAVRRGGFSTVHRVRIHNSHYNFCDDDKRQSFALKSLHSNTSKARFENELAALRMFSGSGSPNSHIVQLLTSFQHGNRYHFLFPWAEGDLSALWRRNPSPPHDARLARWVGAQAQGLSEALVAIHNGSAAPKYGDHEDIACRHGDLKPDNILFFPSFADGSINGKLVLADFGLSEFHRPTPPPTSGRNLGSQHIFGFTPAYCAPELDTSSTRPPELSADIWSLGCVLLELLTWANFGKLGLDRLASARVSACSDGSADPAFFERVGTENEAGGSLGDCRLKPAVVQIIQELYQSSFHPFWDEFLGIITQHLLIEQPRNDHSQQQRMTALQLARRLKRLCDDLNSSIELTGWRPQHPAVALTTATASRLPPLFLANRLRGTSSVPSLPLSQWLGGAAASRAGLAPPILQAEHADTSSKTLTSSASKRPGDTSVSKRGRPRKVKRSDCRPLLACPFFQVNQNFFRQFSNSCSGPGFDDFHRLKEHIQRRHMPSLHVCQRCGEECKSDEGLYRHHMMHDKCEVVERTPAEGFLTHEAMMKLKGRKKWGNGTTEEEKWRVTFGIIFPDHPMPSPYYGHEASAASQSSEAIADTSITTLDPTFSSLSSVVTRSSGSVTSQLADYTESLKRPLPANGEWEFGFQLGWDLGIDPDKCNLLAQRFRFEQLKGIRTALGIPVSQSPPAELTRGAHSDATTAAMAGEFGFEAVDVGEGIIRPDVPSHPELLAPELIRPGEMGQKKGKQKMAERATPTT